MWRNLIALAREQSGANKGMRMKAATFVSLALLALVLAGCDRCGDPVHINIPGQPKTCYDTPQK
jgi:hypothetical protein